MKVTTRGQVTIPREIRDQLGLHAGAEVEFVVEENVVRIVPVKPAGRGKSLVARLRGQGSVQMTTEEIMALTRGEA